MAVKRPHEGDAASAAKKHKKKGFAIGPANLPDGTHRRKSKRLRLRAPAACGAIPLSQLLTALLVEKIKKSLIDRAKIKKQYAKLKAREDKEGAAPPKSVYDREPGDDHANQKSPEPAPEPTLEPHPDRVAMLEENLPEPERQQGFQRRQRRPRPQPFQKETELAQKKREEAEARQKAREEADRERAKKAAERERFRKTMAKARGPNGQRKLGRESTVLLAKAQRLMGKT